MLNCFFPQTNGGPGTFSVCGFIDNTVYNTCRPGGGPTQDGPASPCYHPPIQRSYYNGWKSTHGIKWQTVGLPNGMMFHAWGPVSCRHNDCRTLDASDIKRQMKALQESHVDKYVFNGDSAFFADECIRSRHRGDNRSERDILEVDSMSKCRQSIEWDYGQIGQLWKTIIYKKGLQLRKQPVCSVVTLAFLLSNAYNCMNANITRLWINCIKIHSTH